MQQELVKHQGCVVEWNNGTYSLFNGASQHIWTKHVRPLLDGLTCHIIPKIKFSRKRKPVKVYWIAGECKQEVLVNNFAGVDHDIEKFSIEEQTAEGTNNEINGENRGL